MSVWARNEKNRLVRTASPRNLEESIVSQVSQDNLLPQMDNPENQQGLYEPPQHGGNATLPINPVLGGNGNLQQNQYRAHPAPLPNVERTLREILQPQRTTTNSCIRLPDEANQFLMKSEMIRLLPVYQGFESENPYSFMRDFEDVCSAFLSTGSPLHIICLVLFPFALKEKAKIWFHSLAPNSIFTWENMRNEFLNKFFPPARTNALMRAIQNFSEKPGEPFATVWERYKDLLHAIPHHGLDVGQICAYFHQGLSLSNKQYIQMMCAGEFYEKSAREAIQLFDTIAENARTWETNTSLDTAKVHSTPAGGGIHHLRENDELQAKIANLTRKLEAIEMKKVNEVTSVPQLPLAPNGPRVEEPCIICDDPTHSTISYQIFLKLREPFKLNKPMPLITKGSLSPLHTLKPTILVGVSILILVGEMKEDHITCQIIKALTIQTKVFPIPFLHFRIKVPKDFKEIPIKVIINQTKEIKIHSLTNLHIREVWRI